MTLTRRELILSSLVGGTFALIITLVVVQYLFSTWQSLSRGKVQAEKQLQLMQTLLAQNDLWQQRETWLDAHQPKLENEARAGNQLLTQVQELAKQNGVSVEQQVIGNTERRPECAAVPVTLDTKSTWAALRQFLIRLQGPEQFIVLESANLKVDPGDKTQMLCHFRIAKWYSPK